MCYLIVVAPGLCILYLLLNNSLQGFLFAFARWVITLTIFMCLGAIMPFLNLGMGHPSWVSDELVKASYKNWCQSQGSWFQVTGSMMVGEGLLGCNGTN